MGRPGRPCPRSVLAIIWLKRPAVLNLPRHSNHFFVVHIYMDQQDSASGPLKNMIS